MTNPDTLLTLHDVSRRVSLRRTAIYEAIKAGRFPQPIRISTQRVAWSEREVTDWIAKRIAERDARGVQ
jgi:prophage regulatory protein